MPVVNYTVIEGEVVSEIRGGVRKDYVPDPLGSTVALLDNTQTKTDTWEYWPYGEIRSGSSATPFQYVGTRGYFKDTSSRMYIRARHYRQTSGRWQTVDLLWPSESPYAYCDLNPTTRTDTQGLATCTDTLLSSLGGRGVKPGDAKAVLECFKKCVKNSKSVKKFMQCLVKCLADKGLKDLVPYMIAYSCCSQYGDGKNDPCSEGAHHNDLQCCDSKWCYCVYNTAAEKQKYGMIPEHLYVYSQDCECNVGADAGCNDYTMPGHRT